MKTAHERQEEKRQAKLAQMADQVKAGTLTVRKMTAEEREKYPAKPAAPKKKPAYRSR